MFRMPSLLGGYAEFLKKKKIGILSRGRAIRSLKQTCITTQKNMYLLCIRRLNIYYSKLK
jgi:hypothetical protein